MPACFCATAAAAPRPQVIEQRALYKCQLSSSASHNRLPFDLDSVIPVGICDIKVTLVSLLRVLCVFWQLAVHQVGAGWLAAVSPQTRINFAAPKPTFPPAGLLFPAGTSSRPFIQGARPSAAHQRVHSTHRDLLPGSTLTAPVKNFICSLSYTFLLAIISC